MSKILNEPIIKEANYYRSATSIFKQDSKFSGCEDCLKIFEY